MRNPFTALRVKDMYVDKPALRCVPTIWRIDIFDNILDQFPASSKTHGLKIRAFNVDDPSLRLKWVRRLLRCSLRMALPGLFDTAIGTR